MVTEKKRRSRYTPVAWSVPPTRHGNVLLLTVCDIARDANSARPDAAASNHVTDVGKPARDASIHEQHAIDLPVVHRKCRPCNLEFWSLPHVLLGRGYLSKSQRMPSQRKNVWMMARKV